jgi:hypothetical protein
MDTSGAVDCGAACPKGLLDAAAKGLGLLLAPPSAPKGLEDATVPPENGFGFVPSCEGWPKPPAGAGCVDGCAG